jgi:hypothetical protein
MPLLLGWLPPFGHEIVGEVIKAVQQRSPRVVFGEEDNEPLELFYAHIRPPKSAIFGQPDGLAASIDKE